MLLLCTDNECPSLLLSDVHLFTVDALVRQILNFDEQDDESFCPLVYVSFHFDVCLFVCLFVCFLLFSLLFRYACLRCE